MTAPLPLLTEEEVHAVIRDEVDEHRSFGCLRCEHGNLPLKALDVDARVIGTFAHTTLTQTFKNTNSVPVEATYIFPLPDRAAVTRFTMVVAGRRVEGELQERGQARRTYDAAIAQGKRASIAEEERPGTFTIRVGNLLAGEDATIILEMTGPLSVVDGEVTYRFPLVVAPRYMPGTPLRGDQVGEGTHVDTNAVPDASRISPPVLLANYPNPVQLGIRVSLDPAGLPLSNVRSALHAAWADEKQGLLQVQVGKGERLNRDFILRFTLGDGAMRTSARATSVGVAAGVADTFMLTLLPAMTSTAKRPRDLVFVVDRSGSMSGWKMVAARRAVARMIDTLRGRDRFCVMAFDDSVDYCPAIGRGLVPATDRARFAAVEWLASVDDRGGTEMAQPLSEAADLLTRSEGGLERDRVLVFVTDGQVGNEAQILKLLGKRLQSTRVFALGIDQAVNAGFMNRLAALGAGGEAELVESEDRVDDVLTRCHRRIDTPTLSNLQIDVVDGELVTDSVAPSRLPDVFEGVPALIAGQLRRRGGGKPTIVVRGRDASGVEQTVRVVVEASGNPSLLPAWARLHLRDLEDRFDGHRGDRHQLQQQILRVSLAAKVLCRFTAFVAVDHEVVNEGGRVHQSLQAVETPAGWEGSVDKERASPAAPSMVPGGAPAPAPSRMADMARRASSTSTSTSTSTVSKKRMAPPPQAAFDAAEAEESLDGSLFDSAGFDSFDDGVRSEAAPAAAPPPPSRPTGGFVQRAREAVAEFKGALSSKATPSRPAAPAVVPVVAPERAPLSGSASTTDEAPLAAWFAALSEVLTQLESPGADLEAASDAVRVILEAAAHAGVAPAARGPLQRVLEALGRGELDAAIAALKAILPARSNGFWT
jgi:Ca-activated chloride channel family protein